MLSENEKNNLIEKCKFDLHLKNNSEISESDLKKLIIDNNFDFDLSHVEIDKSWYLVENVYNYYVKYSNCDDLNKFYKVIYDLKHEFLENNKNTIDFSKYIGHIDCSHCNNCINDFRKSKNCLNCNYYKDCMIENEISEFERMKDIELDNYYDMLENDFYR